MAHNRKLVLSAVSLTQARIRNVIPVAAEVRDELERLVIKSGYLNNAPFTWVGLILRFGLINGEKPEYDKIDKKDGELPLAIEIDTNELLGADKQKLKQIFTEATLKALIDAGHKYKLQISALENYEHKNNQ